MGLAVILACFALAAVGQDPAAAPPAPAESSELTVSVPPPQAARTDAPEPKPAAADPAPVRAAIPTDEPKRPSRPLEDRVESGPGMAGFMVGSFAVLGLLGGAFLLLRRFGKNSRLFAGANTIKVLARKPLAPKQEIFLVEVGARVFMIGSTRDHLSTLGEFSSPDEVALLRKDDSARREFNQSLREGLRGEEATGAEPKEERVFASIADELAELRKTVRGWRA